MFDSFKVYFYGFLGIITLGIFTYIKSLRAENKRQAKDIDTLEGNIETQKEIHKDDIKREKFNAVQEEKANEVKDETDLDKLDEERGDVKSDDAFTAVTA